MSSTTTLTPAQLDRMEASLDRLEASMDELEREVHLVLELVEKLKAKLDAKEGRASA